MIEKSTNGEKVFSIFNYLLLGVVTIACAYPMLYAVFASISDPIQLMQHNGVLLWPKGFSLEGYQVVFKNPNITSGYVNTILYTLFGTLISLLLTTMGAYALSRKNYMFKKSLTFAVVFTMYFSGGIIPSFLLVRNIGIYDTRWAMVLPAAVATWNLIVMKTAFQSVPQSLEESAKIDGANDFVVLFKIFVPISLPTMAVMTLFYAVGNWNSWFNAMLYLQDRALYPLQLFLREILIASSAGGNASADVDVFYLEEVLKYATIIVSTVPILCAYPFAQRYFMSGLMLGSIKE